ncbi:MAG: hypothetical protein WBC86_16525, partial [Pseudolabrys sp.]
QRTGCDSAPGSFLSFFVAGTTAEGWNNGRDWDFGRGGANSYAVFPPSGGRYFDRAISDR